MKRPQPAVLFFFFFSRAVVQEEILSAHPADGQLLHHELLQGREDLQGTQRLHLPRLLHRRGAGASGASC